MVRRIQANYPHAKIVCATLMRTVIKGEDTWVFPENLHGTPFEAYNNAIRKVCRKTKCLLADLAALNMCYETLDGTHPTAAGQNTLFLSWITCLRNLGIAS